MNISIFHQIRNTNDLQIGFRLWKLRKYDVVQFNVVSVLNITLNYSEIRGKFNLVGGDNKAVIVRVNEFGYNVRLYILKIPVYISNIVT